jgi:hypothetical protein
MTDLFIENLLKDLTPLPPPPRANWVAQDSGGDWWWYVEEPTMDAPGWAPKGKDGTVRLGYSFGFIGYGRPPEDFSATLHRIEEVTQNRPTSGWPPEARWIAQDANGTWYWYLKKPVSGVSAWVTGYGETMIEGVDYSYMEQGDEPDDWTTTLHPVNCDREPARGVKP